MVALPLLQELSRAALADADLLLERIVARQVAVEPDGFRRPGALDDLRSATSDGLRAVLSVLAAVPVDGDPTGPARRAGRRQVQQDLPLEGVLRAYRLAGQVLWEDLVTRVREGHAERALDVLDGASGVWSVIDGFSAAASEAYRLEESLLRDRDDRVRSSVLVGLLDGRGADPEFASDAVRALGLPDGARLVCVVGTADDPQDAALDGPRERLLAVGVPSTWAATASGLVGLLDVSRSSPDRARRALGPAVRGRAGFQEVQGGLAQLPRARRLAELAASAADAGHLALVTEDLAGALVAEGSTVARVVHERTVGRLLHTAGAEGPDLLQTVRSFLAADCSVSVSAEQSFVHRNTVLHRLNRVDKLTGTHLRTTADQLLWGLALKVEASRT